MTRRDDLSTKVQCHLADATAMLIESTPIFAACEIGLANMPHDVSIKARLLAAGLAYTGVATLYSKGRDLWRNRFGITDKTKESTQTLHDVL